MHFLSVTKIREALTDELDIECDNSIGYYKGRRQEKRWLANGGDVALMYQKYKIEIKFFCGVKDEMKELISKVALV